MLFTLGHGQTIIVAKQGSAPSGAQSGLARPSRKDLRQDAVPLSEVLPGTAGGGNVPSGAAAMPQAGVVGGPFGYLFPDAPVTPTDETTVAKLDALADAMVETEGDPAAQDGAIPPIFTYLGQFIDHDITANTDRTAGASVVVPPEGETLDPLERTAVTGDLLNLRKGSLGLDSVYGDGPDMGPAAEMLRRALRSKTFTGMMRLGLATSVPGQRPPLPADAAVDLLRIGRLLDDGVVTEADILGTPIEPAFAKDGVINRAKAVIGDARNDENLVVAQLHTAMLRFHNRVVVWLQGQPHAPHGDAAVFAKAKQLVQWHYQWLVVNVFLRRICDGAVLDAVIADEASLYRAFSDRVRQAHGGALPEGHLPLPLEFSVAAYRYGHSMVRGTYDYNRFFGRQPDGSGAPGAPFGLLFLFTGNGGLAGAPSLPSNWIIEWDRFVTEAPAFPDRAARKIDTQLAPPLSEMKNEGTGVFAHLAQRNLRRGHRLNLPSAQACIEALNGGAYGAGITALTEEELTSGKTGAAVSEGGFVEATPLWFYVLKEAEVQAGGAHLGQLGSRLVAETLVGLVLGDPSSYWHQGGSDHGRWHPGNGAKPEGQTVIDLPSLLRAALHLEA